MKIIELLPLKVYLFTLTYIILLNCLLASRKELENYTRRGAGSAGSGDWFLSTRRRKSQGKRGLETVYIILKRFGLV